MIKEINLRVFPVEAHNEDNIRAVFCSETGFEASEVCAVRVVKRSIDARQRQVFVNLTVRAFINEEPPSLEYQHIDYKDVSGLQPVIVVGAGPCGLFAALRLIELGLKPIVIERGKDVHERKKDIALISREHRINPESNYCFGEGGAGAFSDGKLFTRSKKRGSVDRILNILCQHGASASILSDAHPHIGTDKLPRVIENIRKTIIRCGGEVHFNTCMTSLLLVNNEVVGIQTADGREFSGPVILATGHSARDVYRYLFDNEIFTEAKGIAVGVRLEHPQELIDRIRYHSADGRGAFLPAAEYSFTAQSGGRGVYSFCMCPGGFIVPAASANGQVVVNGMSPSNRNSRWANAGIVVEIRPEDLPFFHHCDPSFSRSSLSRHYDPSFFRHCDPSFFRHCEERSNPENNPQNHSERHPAESILNIQQQLENLTWQQGGSRQTAPAQRMADFLNNRLSKDLPATSYSPGIISSPLHQWLPEFITTRLKEGFRMFDKVSRGFLTNEAVMVAIESRTSSPVRITRDPATMQHIRLKGLYPCGEGAGYAGGIISSAIDGELAANSLASRSEKMFITFSQTPPAGS
ncbi:MAG: FAD-dependent monooxygenase [Tannerella sp.]|jgi:uncharacterized FAD-dependent dehydrogenase|nr:FAD-dependent monooxygenase [Tannerella sp.]